MGQMDLGQVRPTFNIPGNVARYTLTETGDLESPHEYYWSPGWSHICAGRFHLDSTGDFTSDLLFYNRASGTAGIYDASLALQREYAWEPGWTHITTGNFGGDPLLTDLLLYNQRTGAARMYLARDGALLEPLWPSGWRRNWSHVVAGRFKNDEGHQSLDDLLFYDQASGEAQFYTTDGGGNIAALRQYQWRQGWAHLIPGRFGGSSGFDDLLFYDQGNRLEIYNLERGASMTRLWQNFNWEPGWTHLVPFKIGGAGRTDLVFYKTGSGQAAIYTNGIQGDGRTQSGELRLLRQHHWRAGWQQITRAYTGPAGNVGVNLIFYRNQIFSSRPRPQG